MTKTKEYGIDAVKAWIDNQRQLIVGEAGHHPVVPDWFAGYVAALDKMREELEWVETEGYEVADDEGEQA